MNIIKSHIINFFSLYWTLLCIASIFTNSYSFTDPYITPKWFAVTLLGFGMGIYYLTRILFTEPKEWDLSVLKINISIICCIQALIGILQYFSLYSSHSIFKVTGTFDNPAGFASCLCFGLPFTSVFTLHNNKYIQQTGRLIAGVIVMAVFLSYSRTGIISIIITYAIILCKRFTNRVLWKHLLLASIIGAFTVGCYYIKKDSADGRLLIWQCGLEMFKDAPWLGHGTKSFEAHYMDYQANYFKKNGLQNHYVMLADNIKHPFNEFLLYLLNFGILGLLLLSVFTILLIYCYKKIHTIEKDMTIYTFISIGTFSVFSYPFTYPFTWIIILLSIFILTKEEIKSFFFISWRRNTTCILLMIYFITSLYSLYERIKQEKEWKKATVFASYKNYEKAIPVYKILESKFNDNPYFLYNYAAVLNENKQYQEALKIAIHCRIYWADYNLDLMIGEIYQHLNKPKQAETYYKNAYMMCPSRFLPLNFLYDLYCKTGDEYKALNIAATVMGKHIKVNSLIIKQIRYKMKQALLKASQESGK